MTPVSKRLAALEHKSMPADAGRIVLCELCDKGTHERLTRDMEAQRMAAAREQAGPNGMVVVFELPVASI